MTNTGEETSQPKAGFFKNMTRKQRIVMVIIVAVVAIGAALGARALQVASCDSLVSSCASFLGTSQSPPVDNNVQPNASSQQATADIKKTALVDKCQLDAKLVSSCRPLIGATSNNYPGVSGWKNSVEYLEERAGRRLDIVHSYHSPTQTSIKADEKSFLDRGNTQLYMNWKPDANWGPAGGGNATVNKRIDQMASSIKSLGSKKIYLSIYHEPENDISPGGSKCSSAKGNKGTTQEYRDMWRNVRKRFDAKGVNNVVWVMNYMGWSGWDCAVKDLWPGNDLVDWITWDPYTNDKSTFKKDMSRFYNFLTANTDAKHAFTSKAWGIGEMGYEGWDQQKAYKYYNDMLSTIQKNELPRLKMYLFFDMNAAGFGGPSDWDARVGYSRAGKKDPVEQQRFNTMLSGVVNLTKPQPTDPTPEEPQPGEPNPGPTPTPEQPGPTNPASPIAVGGIANGTIATGTLNIVGVTKQPVKLVTLRVDGKWVATDTTAPYNFQLDTRQYSDRSKHSLIVRAQIGDKKYDSARVDFTVNNKPVPQDPISVSGIKDGATVRGTIGLTGKTRASDRVKLVTLRVDGKWVATDETSPYTFNLNTKKLKNGQHKLILRAWIRGAGYDSRTVTFTVRN